jgi:hypothetical protein
MASNRPSSSRMSKTDSSGMQSQTGTKITTTASNSRVSSSANMTREKQSSISTKTISNIEMFDCFWLDQNIHKTEDNQETQEELRKIINHLRTFENSDECEQVIKTITQEKIILISSGSLGRQIVPRLHDLPQLNACYIFCSDRAANEQWTKNYTKVRKLNILEMRTFMKGKKVESILSDLISIISFS